MVGPWAARLPGGSRTHRPGAVGVATLALLLLGVLVRPSLAQSPHEYEVKAAFLYNFAKFVHWPPDAFATEQDELVICVLGEDPFRGALEAIVAGKSVHGRRIAIRHIDPDDAGECHMLFFAANATFRLRPTLAAVAGRHVLTVGDEGNFADHGGMIAFDVQDNRVRFIINAGAAAESGIEISSQLLKVAANVIAQPPPLR